MDNKLPKVVSENKCEIFDIHSLHLFLLVYFSVPGKALYYNIRVQKDGKKSGKFDSVENA